MVTLSKVWLHLFYAALFLGLVWFGLVWFICSSIQSHMYHWTRQLQITIYNTSYNIQTSTQYSIINNNSKFKDQLEVEFVKMSIQGDSRLVDITAGGDFLGLCDQKSSYKHVSDFGRLRSYDRLKLVIEVNDY